MIISFSGHAGHGKTTATNYLKDWLVADGYKVCKIPYAGYLKFIAKEYFEWNGKKDLEGRTLLQQLGTNIVREKFPDYWVDTVIHFVRVFEDKFDFFLIDDTRFPNEIARWGDFGFDIVKVKINRLNFDNGLTVEQKNHPSETALDNYTHWDYVLNVENSIDDLYKNVIDLFETIRVKD